MNHIDRDNPQRVNLLNMLLDGPVCGLTRNPYIGARISARILELRQLGFTIETRRCEHPRHDHRTKQIEYMLAPGSWNRCPYCGGQHLSWSSPDEQGQRRMKCFDCGKGFTR